jgi:hypothetical protein
MRQLNLPVEKVRRHLLSPKKRRNFKTAAVVAAVATLGVVFLVSRYAESPYASYRAGGGAVTVPTGNKCTNPKIIRLDPKNAQSGITEGKYYVTNDTWNASHYNELSQTLYACNYNSWYAVATMNNDAGDGAVKTSPNVQETWYPKPTNLSSWATITSHFSDVPPGLGPNYGIWEFEYDMWLNGLADSSSPEIMIWTYDNGQAPSGSRSGTFTDAGHIYDVYRSSPPYQYIAFVDRHGNLSGNVNLFDFFNYVISHGWMPASSTLYQICNGVELVSTNGMPEKFTINNFSINMKPALWQYHRRGLPAT